ncbi:MAG: triple tyrosine motif-containing protein [Cyclonatronaceae bacterium]
MSLLCAGLCLLLMAFGLPVSAAASSADTLSVYDFPLPAEAAHQSVYSSVIDRRGIAYFGIKGGLMEFDGLEWRFISVRPEVRITHLAQNSRGRIFAAGPGELGYLQVDETGGTRYQPIDLGDANAPPADPRALIPQGPNMIVVGSNGFLRYLIDEKRLQRRAPEQAMQAEAAAVFEEQLFVNDRRRGLLQTPFGTLFSRDDAPLALQPVPGGSGLRVRGLLTLNEETLLLATISEGLLQLRRGPGGSTAYQLSAWNNEASSFFERYPVSAAHGFGDIIAFGSHGGGILVMNADGSVNQRIGREEGLRENFVFSLLFTNRGRLWAGMSGGVASVLVPGVAESAGRYSDEMQPRPAQNAPPDSADSPEVSAPSPPDPGFLHRAWSNLSGWLTNLIPGYSGITSLDFSDHDPEDFTTILRSVRETKGDSLIFRGAFAQELYGVQELAQADSVQHVFPAEINAFRFSYATNQFEAADDIRHQVLLEGLDREWSNWSTNTYREYTNLPFGSYQFRVRSMNPEGEISVESAFRFQIRPPWHQAGWFYLMQLVLLSSMLGISFYLNKTGRAFAVSQFLIYLVIIITFEYVLVYAQPFFSRFTQGIAFFEIALSVVLVICLTPVEEGYRWLLNKITGFTAEELVARRKAREANKTPGFIEQISSKGRLKR